MKSTSYKYSRLTKEILEDCVTTISKKINQVPHYTIFTGFIGYLYFEIEFLRSNYNIPKTFITSVEQGKYCCMVSIGSKNGLVKAYYNARTNSFDMKKGSELLFTFNSFSNTTFDKIKKYL